MIRQALKERLLDLRKLTLGVTRWLSVISFKENYNMHFSEKPVEQRRLLHAKKSTNDVRLLSLDIRDQYNDRDHAFD